MTIALDYDYAKPATLAQAKKLLVKYKAPRVLAGGTDLVAWLVDGMVEPDILVDIKGISSLGRIKVKGDVVTLGALVTFNDLLESNVIAKRAPMLQDMAAKVASTGIRNRATVLGNLCSAVPCCDAGPSLTVYDGQVHLSGPDGDRTVPLDDWFTGPRQTVRKPTEIATAVSFTVPPKGSGAAWIKLGRYKGEDLAQASVAVIVKPGNVYKVAFGSVAPRPVRGVKIEQLMAGKPLTDDLIAEAVKLLPESISPITDVRSTKEYRMQTMEVMLERGLKAAASRAAGKGPKYGTSLI